METETVLKLLADNRERVEAYNWDKDEPEFCPLCGAEQHEGGEDGNWCEQCYTLYHSCEKYNEPINQTCGYLSDFVAVMLQPDNDHPYSALVEADEDTVRICRENVDEDDRNIYTHIKMNNLPNQERIPFCVCKPGESGSDCCLYLWHCRYCNKYYTSHPD